MKDLAGGDARLNASILEDVFGGARGAVADALVLNAGVALAACEVAGSPQEGVAMAHCVTPARAHLKYCYVLPKHAWPLSAASIFSHADGF